MKKTILAAAVVSTFLSPAISQAFEAKVSGQVNPMVALGGDVEERTFSDNTDEWDALSIYREKGDQTRPRRWFSLRNSVPADSII